MSSKTETGTTKGVKKSELVPKLRFPEFRGEEGWNQMPLGNYLSESRIPGSRGDVARKITVKLWGNGVFEKKEAVRGSINTQYFRRKSGQFIYSKLDFLNQAFGIVPEGLDGYESTVDLPCFDICEALTPMFLLEYVKRKGFYERLGEAADGSRKAKRIQVETFLECQISLPSPVEQQKIAECLSSADEVIAAQGRKVDALKTHKKGLMQQLFPRQGETRPRLRFPEFENPWNGIPLEALSFSVSSGKDQKDAEGGYYLYGSTGIIGKTVTAPYDGPRILVARVGANAGQLTRASGQYGVTDNTLVISLKPSVSLDYIYHYLCTININRLIFGSGQPLITGSILKSLPILVPADTEQRKIADCLSALDALIDTQSGKLQALKSHKRGLIQQLFPSPEEVEA